MTTIDQEIDNQINTLPVRDLNIASFLLASGEVTLVNAERKEPKLVIFHFSPKDKAELLISNYYADTAPLSPRNLFSTQRNLRDLIFSGNGV